MGRMTWREVKRPFDPNAQGRFMLILGPAKMGKTTVAAQLYKIFDADRVFWISGGELDGWRSVYKCVGHEPSGVDLDEFENLGQFWQVLDSLRDKSHDLVVLDSFDGASRWAERHICQADANRRRDRRTGINKLDMRGYGLKLNWTIGTIRDHLYPITLGGTHVIVTCGVKSTELGGEPVLVPDIEGQSALVMPRFFGDVALLKRERGRRHLFFTGFESLSVVGSRSGFPDQVPANEFHQQFSQNLQTQVEESSPEINATEGVAGRGESVNAVTESSSSPGEQWWTTRFPEIGPHYQLTDEDFKARRVNATELSLEQAHEWRQVVIDEARELRKLGQLDQLSRRDLALVCWAYHLNESLEQVAPQHFEL